MDTLIGVILGVVCIIIAMILKGVSFSAFANPAPFVVIFGGTIAAVTVAVPGKELKNITKLFGAAFGKVKGMTTKDAMLKLIDFSGMVRKEGILALEPKVREIDDIFMKRGVALLVDGSDPEFIRKTLTEDIDAMRERHAAGASVFTQAGTYAPTLGVLGAVLGLIAALGNMSDTEALGHAISAAFIATVLGIFTGYVLWHPIANKLKRRSAEEELTKNVIMEGLIALSEGVNSRMLSELLNSLVSPADRLGDEAGEA